MELQESYNFIKKYVSEKDIQQEMAYQTAMLYGAIIDYKRSSMAVPGRIKFVPSSAYLYICERVLANVLACGEMNGIAPAIVRADHGKEDAACFSAAELLESLHGPEVRPQDRAVLLGRLLNWGKERGMTESTIHDCKGDYVNKWAENIKARK